MIRTFRIALVVALLAAFWGTAAAEKTISVNDNNTGVFDQPSVVLNGIVANVAYIGGTGITGPFTVFFAAVNGGADFTNLSLPRDNTVLPILPVAIDNSGAAGSPYFDARHPKIALRSATEAVVLFQARPTSADVVYRPYIARLALTPTSATVISVLQLTGFPAGTLTDGDIEDISFSLVLLDNTVRMAFASRATIASATPFHVYFSRVGLDNAAVVGTPLLLSSGNDDTVTGSDGFRAVPSLGLDALNNSHVAWAANDATPNAGGIYYAMVTSTAAVDNVGIGATEVLGRTLEWSHPSLMVAPTSIVIVAGDESIPGRAGSIGFVILSPAAVEPKNGRPVSIPLVRSFVSGGPAILPSTFDLYRPEAFLDGSVRIHLTGYGVSGSSATYCAIRPATVFPFAEVITVPTPVGLNEFPAELPGDYTKAAFRVFNGKTIVFWSGLIPGLNPDTGNRNLNVTTVQSVLDVPPPAAPEESGCGMAAHPRAGEAGRIPGAALLFLPAAMLAMRRISRGVRRKPRRIVEG